MQLTDLSASQARRLLQRGEISAEDLARACLARFEARDAQVRAWACVRSEQVLAQARELDRRGAAGPKGALHGLPIGVKDVILTADLPTQYNSALYEGFHPRLDAACVSVLRAAGALIFGKTDTVEFAATGRKALTRNPHDLARTPGGSSSGSAAAVADHHVPLCLGTQTGGSMIRPASFCGAYALKPTWGLVSNEGAKRYAVSLDTLGWYGRSVDDLALLLDTLDPQAAPPLTALPATGARIALCRTPMWERAGSDTQAAFEAAAHTLRSAGVAVAELVLPPALAALPDWQLRIMFAEGRTALWSEHRRFPGRLEASLQDQVDNRAGITPQQLREAYDGAALARIEFDRLAAGYDAVLTPSVPGVAPLGLAHTGELVFNGLWTLLHSPCVNLPLWQGEAGLPIGLTLTGPRWSDRQLLRAAALLASLH